MPSQNSFYCRTCNVVLTHNQGELFCPKCGSKFPLIENIPVFIEGLNIEQEKNKRYTEELFIADTKKHSVKIETGDYNKFPAQYFKLLAQNPGLKRMLDLGCGNGILALTIMQHENHIEEIYGLDISLNALLNFRRNAAENKIDKKITLLCAVAENMFLPDNYFDIVVCNKFIHHLPLRPLLKEIHRVLKPGGYFICFREPHRNYFTTYFRVGYYTLINLVSFVIQRFIRNKSYKGDLMYKIETKKYLYPRSYIEKALKNEGFGNSVFYLSKFLFPFTKMLLYPFYLKFSGLRSYFSSIIKLVYKIDSYIAEKVIFRDLLQEISFYSRKL